ncbi:hypothetical protein [Sphingomonas sp.]|uniref:hypothetical protein n=1 Tax=Sphingomonas sp. TaxID=28214 RepID=UPI003B3B405D
MEGAVSEKRDPKKSEAIEIRLSHVAKSAFMDRCREDGISASQAIRTMIDARIADHQNAGRGRSAGWRTIAAVAAGMVFGAGAAAPALAYANQTSHAAFDRLDRNHDGVLSYAEFRAR